MRFWMKPPLSEGQGSGLTFVCLVLLLHGAATGFTQDSIPAFELSVGGEVVLRFSGTPLFDQGAKFRAWTTSRSWSNGSNKIVSWSFPVTKASAAGCSATRSFPWNGRMSISPGLSPTIPAMPRRSGFTPEYCTIATTLSAALANVNRAIRLEPDQARFYITRALVQLRRQQADRAIEDCDQAIQIDPTSARPYTIRAHAWLSKDDAPRARADLEMAVRLDPTNPTVVQKDPLEQAPTIIKVSARDDKEARSDPLTAAELVKQGEDRLASNESDRALADFNGAIKLDPDYAPAYASRARAWAKKHYRDREIADQTEAIRRDPNNASYRVARAESWSAQGMHEQAMADFDAALRMEPNNPSFWVSRGNEWRGDLKFDDAIADYTHALQINPRTHRLISLGEMSGRNGASLTGRSRNSRS